MIVQLVGPPACGKRTIGALVAERLGAQLIDNHLINDPVFTALGANGFGDLPPAAFGYARRVRDIVNEAVTEAPASVRHVFTNWLIDTEDDRRSAADLRQIARARGASFHPVWLTCDPAEIHRRIDHPDRRSRNKLRDPAKVADALSKQALPAPDDALRLDTTTLPAADAADRIVAWIDDRG
ncbi:AAA family ATPase [Flexivirga meconopsidis]|uniref:AAA family ATPase n=1 Tax=Flexivirga meconopsidis TaxID=2977121 RepID=UPI003CC59F42